jgi:hypothetical protein
MDHVMADAGTMVKCEKSMEHDKKRRREINGKKRGKNRIRSEGREGREVVSTMK